MKTFKELGLNPEIMKSLDDLGFIEPSPIQEKAIPFILKNKKDLIALAQTGTGKTAAFGLPILNEIKGRELEAFIICPTRELCIQIAGDIKKYAKYSKNISVTPVYGGANIEQQIYSLRRGTNIVVGTPGRVCDLIRRKALKLQTIKWLVLDEADEMLDMGFKADLDTILEQTPHSKRTLLFSATISPSVQTIAKKYMKESEEISIGEKNIGAENVSHEYYLVQAKDRFQALQRILDSLPGVYGILFCRTRHQTQDIADRLKQTGYDTEALHGEISQNMRTKIMDRFKRQDVKLLVATDVAARGIDVNSLSHVINYSLPDQNESYTHRSGRTGRAQKSGISISILTKADVRRIRGLESMIGKSFEQKQIPSGEEIQQKQLDNFIEEVKNTEITGGIKGKQFKDFSDKLNKMTKDDLIKYIIANKFSHTMDTYEGNRDLNKNVDEGSGRQRNENAIEIEINIGKKHGFDVPSLFNLINSNRNLKGAEIGKIDLMLEYSIFGVDKERVDDMIRELRGSEFRGYKINVKKYQETVSSPRRAVAGPRRTRTGGNQGTRGMKRKGRDTRRTKR